MYHFRLTEEGHEMNFGLMQHPEEVECRVRINSIRDKGRYSIQDARNLCLEQNPTFSAKHNVCWIREVSHTWTTLSL